MMFREVENGISSQKIESKHFYHPKTKLSPLSLSLPPRQRQITHFSQLRGRTMKTYFKIYCFKSTFLKDVTEEFTFCWKVLQVNLSKNLVATITEFLSLFVTVTINIYIQQHIIYLPELKVTSITIYFFWTKYKFKIITNVYMLQF